MMPLLFMLAAFAVYISRWFFLLCPIYGIIFAKYALPKQESRYSDKLFATYRQDTIFFSFMFLSPLIAYLIIGTSENHIDLLEANDYRLKVIKDCNPNLTEKEAEIIAENIGIIDYIPLFLDYRAKKNVELEEKENLKMEQWATEKRQQKIEEEKNKKLLDDFLSKKCNQGAEKC